jgi:tripartite-type tricarboxylate transporter receptor subunit TctC
MNKEMHKQAYRIFAGIGFVLIAASAQCQTAEEFYKGKTVTVVASTGAGGPLDLIARTIAKHMARHIPGSPTMIVRNMPGAGHVLATNFMFNQAPKDGTYIATVVNSIPLHQVIDGRGVRYDARKFNWIGATGVSNLMTVAWAASKVRTIEDVKKTDVPTGATGVGSGTFIYTNAMNIVLGTKFKMILGYGSSTDIDLAMERG